MATSKSTTKERNACHGDRVGAMVLIDEEDTITTVTFNWWQHQWVWVHT